MHFKKPPWHFNASREFDIMNTKSFVKRAIAFLHAIKNIFIGGNMTIAHIEMLAVKLTRVFRYQLQFTV